MPLTIKSIIATVFHLCTLAVAGYLWILALAFYLYTPNPLDTSVKIPHDRFPQLNESYSSLNDNVAYHQAHVTGPFTEALLDQMVAVTNQVSDTIFDLGCAEQKHMEHICYVLMSEEMRLRVNILTKRVEMYTDAEEEVERYIDAAMAEVERYIVAAEEEVERYIDAEKKGMKRKPLSK